MVPTELTHEDECYCRFSNDNRVTPSNKRCHEKCGSWMEEVLCTMLDLSSRSAVMLGLIAVVREGRHKGITKVWKAFLLRFIFLFTIGCPRVWIDPGLETARNGQDQLSVSRISPSVPTSRIIDARRLSLIGIRELVNALCLRACRPWYLFHDDERRSAGRSMRAYLPSQQTSG